MVGLEWMQPNVKCEAGRPNVHKGLAVKLNPLL